MTNPLETARKNLHKRYQLLAQDLGRVVSMLTLHEHTSFKTVQPAIDILQELITGLTDSERLADNDRMVFGTSAQVADTSSDGEKLNKFNVGDMVIFNNRKYTIIDIDFEKKWYKLDQHLYVYFNTIHAIMENYTEDSVRSVPHYPLDDEEQVTVVGSVGNDPINPNHYKTNSGVECIDLSSEFSFLIGNAIKYAWRAGSKDDLAQDLKKCEWYLNRAMANGEIIFLKPHTQATYKAWHKFKQVENELPKRNAEVLAQILQGHLQVALNLLDSWLTELADGE